MWVCLYICLFIWYCKNHINLIDYNINKILIFLIVKIHTKGLQGRVAQLQFILSLSVYVVMQSFREKWRHPSLSELTPIISNMELTYLDLEASTWKTDRSSSIGGLQWKHTQHKIKKTNNVSINNNIIDYWSISIIKNHVNVIFIEEKT